MQIKVTIIVPLPTPKGIEPGDFHPNLQHDTQQVDQLLPPEAMIVSSEYVPDVEDTKAVFKKFLRFKVEGAPPRGFKSGDYYSKGDEDAPFYSESYLYNLLGKDNARSVLGYLHHLMQVCGLDPLQVEREVNAEIAAETKIENDRLERVARRRAFIDDFAKKKGWPPRDKKTILGFPDDKWKEIKAALSEAGL